MSTHDDGTIKLWQLNKLKGKEGGAEYEFMKTKEYLAGDIHLDKIICQGTSPCGQFVATLGSDEQLALWKLFEPT